MDFETISTIVIRVMAFLFGMTIGSFLNVCIYRLPAGESLTKKNSHCMTCGTPIKWYDLVPIFSWLILRGKCRACGSKISGRYILVESLTAVLFVMTLWRFDVIVSGLLYPALLCLFISGLIVVGFEDYDTQEMTVGVLIYLAIIAFITRVLTATVPQMFRACEISLEDGLIGIFAVSVPFLLIGFVITPLICNIADEDRRSARKIRKRLKSKKLDKAEERKLEKALETHLAAIKEKPPVFGFGMGDILLMAAGGLMYGWKAAVFAAFAAIILGAICGCIVKYKAAHSDGNDVKAVAFGPFLTIGLGIASFCGNQLVDMYINYFTSSMHLN